MYTMENAARAGHSEAFKWLHENRSEGCSEEALGTDNSEILDCMARSTTYFILEQIIEAKHGHFDTIASILRGTYAGGSIRVEFESVGLN